MSLTHICHRYVTITCTLLRFSFFDHRAFHYTHASFSTSSILSFYQFLYVFFYASVPGIRFYGLSCPVCTGALPINRSCITCCSASCATPIFRILSPFSSRPDLPPPHLRFTPVFRFHPSSSERKLSIYGFHEIVDHRPSDESSMQPRYDLPLGIYSTVAGNTGLFEKISEMEMRTR